MDWEICPKALNSRGINLSIGLGVYFVRGRSLEQFATIFFIEGSKVEELQYRWCVVWFGSTSC